MYQAGEDFGRGLVGVLLCHGAKGALVRAALVRAHGVALVGFVAQSCGKQDFFARDVNCDGAAIGIAAGFGAAQCRGAVAAGHQGFDLPAFVRPKCFVFEQRGEFREASAVKQCAKARGGAVIVMPCRGVRGERRARALKESVGLKAHLCFAVAALPAVRFVGFTWVALLHLAAKWQGYRRVDLLGVLHGVDAHEGAFGGGRHHIKA